jgi:hypothetical protein
MAPLQPYTSPPPLAKRPPRAARQPAAAKIDALLRLLSDNPLEAYALPCILPLGDKTIAHLRTATGASLEIADHIWALHAVESALRPMYDRSLSSSSASASAPAFSLRWSATEERRELCAPGKR